MTKQDGAQSRQMKICLFMCGNTSSYHAAGWRLPGAYADLGSNFQRWVQLAQKMESAKFDMLFVADVIGPMEFNNPNREVFARSGSADRLDPPTLLAGLAAVTSRIGLAATVATSYSQPYNVARQMASLDLISGGRAGWNVVTGVFAEDAAQYGGQCGSVYGEKHDRYEQGEEFVDVVAALWGSVESGAYLRNQKTGIYADPGKVHLINHTGKYYEVKGPLSVDASPQGRPILIQAGQSDAGRALAARIADVIFTAQSSFELAQAYYIDVKKRVVAFGRDPDSVKILPGFMPIIGRTPEEADEKEAALAALLDPILSFGKIQMWLRQIGFNESQLDGPFPELPAAATARAINFATEAKRDNLTLRQVLTRAVVSQGHFMIKGTIIQVADTLEHWFKNQAADGFNLLCPSVPSSLDDFIELILPELRRRGLFRTDYEGPTLRENLGLSVRPIPRRANPA